MKTDNPATGIKGVRTDKIVTDEAEHFCICEECGQAFDMRELGEVFHHSEPGHDPLSLDS